MVHVTETKPDTAVQVGEEAGAVICDGKVNSSESPVTISKLGVTLIVTGAV